MRESEEIGVHVSILHPFFLLLSSTPLSSSLSLTLSLSSLRVALRDHDKLLRVVTFNVLFDMHTPELIHTQHRVPVLLDLLNKTDAHVRVVEEERSERDRIENMEERGEIDLPVL